MIITDVSHKFDGIGVARATGTRDPIIRLILLAGRIVGRISSVLLQDDTCSIVEISVWKISSNFDWRCSCFCQETKSPFQSAFID